MNERVLPPAGPSHIHIEPMQKLADRLTSLVPPAAALPLVAGTELPRPSAAVTAALEKSAARAAQAARKAARRSRPLTARLAEAFAIACSYAVPYALVALALRVVIARVFFLDGQTKVLGPQMSVSIYGIDFSVILPLQIKTGVLNAYGVLAASLPVSPSLVAYVVAYAGFVLPIMLVLGFGTRLAALALLGLTVFFDLYVTPQALWSAHVYWGAILLTLVSLGGGVISLDGLFRFFSRR
jgi:putative oxidoreductase